MENVNRRYGTGMATGDQSEGRLQKLLFSGQYRELDDMVLIEDQFIEINEGREPIRQVTLGITLENVITAKHVVANYRDHPWVYYDTEMDFEIHDMELESILPLCFVELAVISDEGEDTMLEAALKSGKSRYFIMTNIDRNRMQRWEKWTRMLNVMEKDRYGIVRRYRSKRNTHFESGNSNVNKKTPTTTKESMSKMKEDQVSVTPYTPGSNRELEADTDNEKFRHVAVQCHLKPRKRWWKKLNCFR